MAPTIPIYHWGDNASWLDRLVGGIIDPNYRVPCLTLDKVEDDDAVEDPESSGNRAARTLAFVNEQETGHPWGQLATPLPRPSSALGVQSPNDGCNSSSTSAHQNGGQQGPLSSPIIGRCLSSRASQASVRSILPQRRVDGGNRLVPSTTRSISHRTLTSLKDPHTQREPSTRATSRASSSATRKKRPVMAFNQQRASARTSLGRTRSQQRLTSSSHESPQPRPSRSPSTISITAEIADHEKKVAFLPHPAVRPLDIPMALGAAVQSPDEEDEHQYPAPLALTLIIIGICLSVFIISVDRNVVTTAIPKITEEFKTYGDIGWYGSAYFITASGFQPLYGRIYMSFDTRWSFLVALFIFEAGSALGGASPNSTALIIGRAIQGVGSAGILTGSFVVATHSVRLRTRPLLFACVGVLYGVGALAGPLIGGAFTDYVTWRWAFYINLPVGAVTFVGVLFCFKPRENLNGLTDPPPWIRRILQLDLIGNALCIGAAVQLFLGLQISETKGAWDNAPVTGLLCGCGATLLIFIAWIYWKGDTALIPPKIIRQRTVAASCGAAFFIYGALLIHAYYLPIWFQAIRGDSAILSGVHMIPYLLANALFSLLAGAFVSKNGLFAPPAILGCAIGTIGCGFITTLRPTSSVGTYVGFEILVSVGMGMAIQQGFSAVQTALPSEEVPIGTAAVVASQSLGGAIFVSVGNTILQDRLLAPANAEIVPGVDLRAVFHEGATVFRQFVPSEQLPAVIGLYNNSLQTVFITAIPLCGLAFLCSLCMEWRSVRTKQEEIRPRDAGFAAAEDKAPLSARVGEKSKPSSSETEVCRVQSV